MEVKIKKLHKDAVIPTYGTEGAACFDLYAVSSDGDTLTQVIRTGLSVEVPKGYAMLVFSRSGDGFRENTRLANCVGVIDSDYRGEVKVKLIRDYGSIRYVRKGDRIAQAMIVPYPRVEFTVVDKLNETHRGINGIGSTGK